MVVWKRDGGSVVPFSGRRTQVPRAARSAIWGVVFYVPFLRLKRGPVVRVFPFFACRLLRSHKQPFCGGCPIGNLAGVRRIHALGVFFVLFFIFRYFGRLRLI